jgi:DNA repair protein RAD16
VITPEKADPPAGLKLNLLPFQLEGLGWLRKQESCDFHGGVLAVSCHFVLVLVRLLASLLIT